MKPIIVLQNGDKIVFVTDNVHPNDYVLVKVPYNTSPEIITNILKDLSKYFDVNTIPMCVTNELIKEVVIE